MEKKRETSVRRFDYGQLGEIERTSQGFLKIPGFATRVGVFTYIGADGSVRRELRHPDDVMAPESLKTLKYAPVTIEHPPEMVTPENVDEYRVGHTTERVEVNRDLVETDFIVESQQAIDAIERDGMRETSAGYQADIVEEKGDFNGAPYDFRQKNIRYNHVAIVRRGRAGPEVRLRLDSSDAIMQQPGAPGQIEPIAATQSVEAPPVVELGVMPTRAEFGVSTSVNDDEGGEKGTKTVVISGREITLPAAEADIVQDMLDRFDELRAITMKLEDEMKQTRKDQMDVDVSKPSPSPQVKVEQGLPDGTKSAGKIAPSDKMGAQRAKGIADEEPMKGDKDEHGVVGGVAPLGKADEKGEQKKDYDMGGKAAMSPVDLLKHELEEVENAMKGLQVKKDGLMQKMDAMANASMGAGEKKMDSADVQVAIRKRAKLERKAASLLPTEIVERFDSWTDAQIMAAVIKHHAPRADLSGKSEIYLQSRFDSIVEAEEERESSRVREHMGRAMLGEGRTDSEEKLDPAQARMKMIQGSRELWKQPLTAGRK